MSLEPAPEVPGLQACIQHVEDGLAWTSDAVDGLGLGPSG
jgi:hypothetical protein